MRKHTKEPWMAWKDGSGRDLFGPATNYTAGQCFHTPDIDACEANVRRIVACVNACKGIKTESLEMEVLSLITDETGKSSLKRERDELLEVLDNVEKRCASDGFVGQDGQYLKVIRAVIAKAGAGG